LLLHLFETENLFLFPDLLAGDLGTEALQLFGEVGVAAVDVESLIYSGFSLCN
jgi:hypothetical protein